MVMSIFTLIQQTLGGLTTIWPSGSPPNAADERYQHFAVHTSRLRSRPRRGDAAVVLPCVPDRARSDGGGRSLSAAARRRSTPAPPAPRPDAGQPIADAPGGSRPHFAHAIRTDQQHFRRETALPEIGFEIDDTWPLLPGRGPPGRFGRLRSPSSRNSIALAPLEVRVALTSSRRRQSALAIIRVPDRSAPDSSTSSPRCDRSVTRTASGWSASARHQSATSRAWHAGSAAAGRRRRYMHSRASRTVPGGCFSKVIQALAIELCVPCVRVVNPLCRRAARESVTTRVLLEPDDANEFQ